MIHVSNVRGLEIAVDRDRSMSVERKAQFGEGDLSDVREAPLLPEVNRLGILSWTHDFDA